MCDFCGCRSHPPIAALSSEHEVMLELVAKLRSSVTDPNWDGAPTAELLEALHVMLGPHGELEERVVFPVLRAADVAEDYLEHFAHDHTGLDAMLVEAQSDHSKVLDLALAIETHIHEEETDTFPAAQQILSPAEWDEMERRMSESQ